MSKSLPGNVYMIISAADPINYYRPDIKIHNLSSEAPTDSKITVLPYISEIHGVDYLSRLKSLGYIQKEVTSYSGPLTKEVWQKSAE